MRLQERDMVVLAELTSSKWQYADSIAEKLPWNVQRVTRSLLRLEEHGLIEVDRSQRHFGNRYRKVYDGS